MKKRALCITMAMALAVTTFTACGEKKNNGAPTGKKDKKEKVFDFSDDEVDDSDDELEMAGLDRSELEFMDEDERREVLEDAGLDPDDFDF